MSANDPSSEGDESFNDSDSLDDESAPGAERHGVLGCSISVL